MPDDTLVTVAALARMLGWSRSNVWYWLIRTNVATESLPGLPYRYVRLAQLSEVLFRLQAARAARAHDGHVQGRRPRGYRRASRPPGGVY